MVEFIHIYFQYCDFLAKLILVEHHSGSQLFFHDEMHSAGRKKSATRDIYVEERLPGEAEELEVA